MQSNRKIQPFFFSRRMRRRPEPGNIRRAFRSDSDTTSPGASSGGIGGVRTASLPVGGALVKDTGDKRPVSAHSILNSVTRHSSLKTKVLFNHVLFYLCQIYISKWTVVAFGRHLTEAVMNI